MKHDRSPEDKPLVATRDIFTIPNAISLCGAALAWKGAETAETSNFGALTDASLDKIATAKIIYEFTKKDIIPREIAAALASLQAANALATAATMLKYPGKSIRPTTSGKLAMTGEMASIFAYGIGAAAERSGHETIATVSRAVGGLAFAASLPCALHSSYTYVRQAAQ